MSSNGKIFRFSPYFKIFNQKFQTLYVLSIKKKPVGKDCKHAVLRIWDVCTGSWLRIRIKEFKYF